MFSGYPFLVNTLYVVNLILLILGIISIGGILYAIYLWFTGILSVLIRLGYGLSVRKIAIFARGDNFSSLKSLLLDSGIIKEKNIFHVGTGDDLGRAETATMYLVSWADWKLEIEQILEMKRDKCALIVYAPYNDGRIPDEMMIKLDAKRHTTVTNFRGRLLNDIVSSMITTSYEKK